MAETTDIIDDPLPPDIRNQLTDMLQPSETIQFSTTSDIRLDGTFGESWLLATDLQFLSFGLNAGAVSDIVQLPLQEITGIEVKDLVGSGQLKARTANEGATLARFSKGLNPKFNDVAKSYTTTMCKNCVTGRYSNITGLINLLISLIVSTIIIYAINLIAGVAGADYIFTNGEVFVMWILMAILVNNCFKS